MTSTLLSDLHEIPGLYALLPLMLLPGASRYASTGATSESRPPSRLDILALLDQREKPDASPTRDDADLDRAAWTWQDGADRRVAERAARRQGVLPTLASWVRLVDAELWDRDIAHDPPADAPTVATECGFLAARHHWIRRQQWGDELDLDIADIHHALRRALGEPDMGALTCVQPGCGWHVQPMDGGAWYQCAGCGRSWGRLELHKMAERERPRTIRECAAAVGVSTRTLRRAIADGALRHVAADRGTRLYRIPDAALVAARVRLRNAEITRA